MSSDENQTREAGQIEDKAPKAKLPFLTPREKTEYEKEDVSVLKIAAITILSVVTLAVIFFLLSQFFDLTLEKQIRQTILNP